MGMRGEVLENFRYHADQDFGKSASLIVSRIAQCLIDIVDEKSSFGRRLIGWGDSAGPDALALRAIAAFHALKLSGMAPDLTAHYPPNQTDDAALRRVIVSTLEVHDEFLAKYLDSPPQTNEVARSSMILGAALHVAAQTRLPISLLEIGASAGLNLWFSKFSYDFGNGLSWGSAQAPLTIKSNWQGNVPPLDAPLKIVDRKGCDQNPLFPSNQDDRSRILSYIWPDQLERMDRISRALEFAATQQRCVEKADAADWVECELVKPSNPATVRMLYHTVFWQYLPQETKVRITKAINSAGAVATEQTPLAWFRFETDDNHEDGGRMELTLWPEGNTRQLGRANFHGRWVRWT